MNQTEYKVEKPMELLAFLMEKMAGASRSKVKEVLTHSVSVDGKKTSQFNYPLMPGMTVTIGVKKYIRIVRLFNIIKRLRTAKSLQSTQRIEIRRNGTIPVCNLSILILPTISTII